MLNMDLVLTANREFSALLKRFRTGGAGTDPQRLALGLGITEMGYYRLEQTPVLVPARLLYAAINQLGGNAMNEAGHLWNDLQIRRFRSTCGAKAVS